MARRVQYAFISGQWLAIVFFQAICYTVLISEALMRSFCGTIMHIAYLRRTGEHAAIQTVRRISYGKSDFEILPLYYSL